MILLFHSIFLDVRAWYKQKKALNSKVYDNETWIVLSHVCLTGFEENYDKLFDSEFILNQMYYFYKDTH